LAGMPCNPQPFDSAADEFGGGIADYGDGVDGPCSPASMCLNVVVDQQRHQQKGPSMDKIITIGFDLAKHVFQVHGVDQAGQVLIRRQLRRAEVLKFFAKLSPCLVGMEACASAHHWARRLAKLGHEVRLLPPAQVKPYVKRGKKNDATDAAAIAEAVTRPHMRFVPVKSAEQQAVLMLHRTRDLLVRQRTMLINALRAHLTEFGIVAGQGRANVAKLVATLDAGDEAIPEVARAALRQLVAQIDDGEKKIMALNDEIVAWHRSCEASCNLASIPGIGPITASAIAASVPDASVFKSGREFAAWLGLVPRQNSSGGKDHLGGITKMGDRYLRRLLVIGATGRLRYARKKKPGEGDWLTDLLSRKPPRVASVALANKMARIAWALLARGEAYRQTPLVQTA
jgi:transposase